jgi:adenylate cyclase
MPDPLDLPEGMEVLVPWWRSFVFRFVGLFALAMAGLVVVAIALLDRSARQEVEDKFGLALESVAATAATAIDGDSVAAIHSNADTTGEAFQRVRAQLEAVRAANHLTEEEVYILRARPDGSWEFAVMLQDKTFVGDAYSPPPVLADRYRSVATRRASARTPLYTDAHGTFISGLAPVLSKDGSVVGILHVDYGVDKVLLEVQRRTDTLLVLGAVLIASIGAAGVFTHGIMRRKVQALLAGTRAIRAGDYDFRVKLMGADELASLGAALNDVIKRLKERFEMLKFLPKHTAAMIRNASQGGNVGLDIAKRVRIVVLESDIRGFSTLSENLSPEATIGMLNSYIRAQAELVATAGGSIDKYMGDAVLAVFDGEGMEQRAVHCAIAIQRAVAVMNEQGAFEVPIQVGVGLSVGEVVMGNMGSEQRMEYTVIGATVNLAARLCSAAGRGEIVVQRELWDTAAVRFDGAAPLGEEIRVKGFAQPVACIRLSTIGSTQTSRLSS